MRTTVIGAAGCGAVNMAMIAAALSADVELPSAAVEASAEVGGTGLAAGTGAGAGRPGRAPAHAAAKAPNNPAIRQDSARAPRPALCNTPSPARTHIQKRRKGFLR